MDVASERLVPRPLKTKFVPLCHTPKFQILECD
jgi:hypothetical protein